MNQLLQGRATPTGTRAYAERHAAIDPPAAPGHFRTWKGMGQGLEEGLMLSSIGLGTYLGSDDEATDRLYGAAIERAFELGCNVIDSAINYRSQRSERSVGAALAHAVAAGTLGREEIVISTKGGYVPFDGSRPQNYRAYLEETYLRPGIIPREELVEECHCLAPRYLEDQIERSRRNLGLGAIDIYYLHNPETQLDAVPREEFRRRLRAAFTVLEAACADGRIGVYGAATWTGFRQRAGTREELDLEELLGLAAEVGGRDHHFRVVQLPINLTMLEAHELANQRSGGSLRPFLAVAAQHGVLVMASASVQQGRLTRNLPAQLRQKLSGLQTDAQRALQVVRSLPGLGTALVGMKQKAHVEENLSVARVPPLASDELAALLPSA
jgi:aryl-alcohol dehydrogenase-like predicted oxidoreductase